MKQLWKDEMVNAKTRCWAQGMDGWRALHLIPQLKWSLLATGQAVLNETDLATLILNMLIRMCEYYPSRYLLSVHLGVCDGCGVDVNWTNEDKDLTYTDLQYKLYR